MNKLSGVRADTVSSYSKLESLANHVREVLEFGSQEAIDPLRLFEDLHEITLKSSGKTISLRSGVVDLDDSEGYARL